MYFHHRLAVFERIGLFNGFAGQFAFFADRDEPLAKLVRNGTAKDKAARLEPDDFVDVLSRKGGQ